MKRDEMQSVTPNVTTNNTRKSGNQSCPFQNCNNNLNKRERLKTVDLTKARKMEALSLIINNMIIHPPPRTLLTLEEILFHGGLRDKVL